MSALEISANVLNLLGVFLAARNNAWTWPLGIVGCVLYGVMFFDVKLYADMTLQGFYIITALYGWRLWRRGGDNEEELPITRVGLRQFLLLSLAAVVVTGLYGLMLLKTTDASYPFIDSLILSFSVMGQLLQMKRKIECWPVWILVNTLSIPLFASKGLILTSLVYGLFWVSAVWGHFQWRTGGKEVHP